MRIEGHLPPPILGVSTATRTKMGDGKAVVQENFRSNPKFMLKRRPPIQFVRKLSDGIRKLIFHYVERLGKILGVILYDDGEVQVWRDHVMTSRYLPTEYMGDLKDMRVLSINDFIVILNTDKVVAMDDFIKGHDKQCTHINVEIALAYESSVKLELSRVSPEGVVKAVKYITYTVDAVNYDTDDYGAADKSRSTYEVAKGLMANISGNDYAGAIGDLPSVWSAVDNFGKYVGSIGDANGWAEYQAVRSDLATQKADIDGQIMVLLNDMKLLSGELSGVADPVGYDATYAALSVPVGGIQGIIDYMQGVLNNISGSGLDDSSMNIWISQAQVAKDLSLGYLSTLAAPPIAELMLGSFRAKQLGSNISVYIDEEGTLDTVQITMEKGSGDGNISIIHPVTASTSGLPLYAAAGSVLTIEPDPSNDNVTKTSGNYYLIANPIKKGALDKEMTEVIWQETANPWIKNRINQGTMPCTLMVGIEPTIDGSEIVASWDLGSSWRDREKGDEISCPNPSFIGKTINSMTFFQGRMVFISDDNVAMTETTDVYNFFKASALKLLVTDPVDVGSSALAVDKLIYTAVHNKDLLLFSRNAQFKIPGNKAITPQSISMSLTTRHDIDVNVSPIEVGHRIFFGTDYGDSAGVLEYTGLVNTTMDTTLDITSDVVGYIRGDLKMFAASRNLNVMVCTSTNEPGNVLFVNEMFGKYNSWSKWILPECVIEGAYFTTEHLYVIVTKDVTELKRFKLSKEETKGLGEIYLDDIQPADNIPLGYGEYVAFAGEDGDFREVGITSAEYVGKRYTSVYIPKPIYRSDKGQAQLGERIRVTSFHVHTENTYKLSMEKVGFGSVPNKHTVENLSRVSNDILYNYCWDGVADFYFKDDMLLFDAKFSTDSYLNCTVNSIMWRGQYKERSRKL